MKIDHEELQQLADHFEAEAAKARADVQEAIRLVSAVLTFLEERPHMCPFSYEVQERWTPIKRAAFELARSETPTPVRIPTLLHCDLKSYLQGLIDARDKIKSTPDD